MTRLLPDNATQDLARWISGSDRREYGEETLRRARHAVLDWFAVAIAGARDPLVDILLTDAVEDGSRGTSTLPGRSERVSVSAAALINGAASHALDYDDVHARLHGHPSVAVLPAVLAVAEQRNVSGAALLDAFIVGYEVACVLGGMLQEHYDAGWHATGTLGTIGAAAGVSRLLALNVEQCENALGLAATQASGLKAMFGTMAKPLHAGRAAHNGLLAARWAARGFTAGAGAIEGHQGFVYTHAKNIGEGQLPSNGDAFAIESGLFKFHAACYLTHSAIEAASAIRRKHSLTPDAVDKIRLEIAPPLRNVCDIVQPASGLQVKFSIRHLTAMAMHDVDTASLGIYSDETAQRHDLVHLRERVELVDSDAVPRMGTTVTVHTHDGRSLTASFDAGLPLTDTLQQEGKLNDKFEQLVSPMLGKESSGNLLAQIHAIDGLASVQPLLAATQLPAQHAATA